MKPLEIQTALGTLVKEMGTNADVFCTIEARYTKPLSISAYPEGITKGCAFRAEADDWHELFALANEKWAERQADFHARIVKEIALEVIRITHEFGHCTDAALRGTTYTVLRGTTYTVADIARYGSEAIEEANKMAANGPFAIVSAEKANAA